MNENGILEKIQKAEFYSTKDQIEYYVKNFPPKHVKDFQEKVPKLEPGADKKSVKRAMIRFIYLYHTDKISQDFDDEYIVICEEIAKIFTAKYSNLKMAM